MLILQRGVHFPTVECFKWQDCWGPSGKGASESIQYLFNSYSPYPSHHRPLRSTSQQHEGLQPPWAHWLPPVGHKNKPFQWPNRTTSSLFHRWFRLGDILHTTRGVHFSSQLSPIKCDCLRGTQSLNYAPRTGCCHSCYLASYQRVISSIRRLGFLELFEVVSAGHIHLNAVSARTYKTGQHVMVRLKQNALDLTINLLRDYVCLTASAKQPPFQN